jgi:tRNA (mo5U34)-methyltransferase
MRSSLRRRQWSAEELRARADALDPWFHSIELGHGVVTNGKPVEAQEEHWKLMDLGSLKGRTFIDIGGIDGWYALQAEAAGADRAAVLDHYLWYVDRVNCHRWLTAQRGDGTIPVALHESPWWDPKGKPGKRNIDFALDVLGSGVETIEADFASCDLAKIGAWDVVSCLGVLYHIEEPLTYLRRLRRITRHQLIIETEAFVAPEYPEPMWRFFPFGELNQDVTNWWAPNIGALLGALGAAGFSNADVLVGGPDPLIPDAGLQHFRALVRASA